MREEDQLLLIIYSLGNWISSMKAKDCRITASLKSRTKDGSVCGIKVFPYFFNLSKMQLVPLSNPALISPNHLHTIWIVAHIIHTKDSSTD